MSPAALANTAPATRWAATHTQAIQLKSGLLGAAPAGRTVRLEIALPLRNRAQGEALVRAHRLISRQQAVSQFSPSTSTVAAVTRHLRAEGFTGISVAANRLLIGAHAPVAQAERAFNTRIEASSLDGHTVLANVSAPQVPASLQGEVLAVVGLQTIPMQVPSLKVTHTAATPPIPPGLSGFYFKALQNAYDATSLPAANNTEIAIIAGGDMVPVIKDLRSLTTGLWARVDNTSGDRFGLAQYDFYLLYNATIPATVESAATGPVYLPNPTPQPVAGFRDITVGTNGGCLAKPGYDPCKGIGSVQAAALAQALTKAIPLPATSTSTRTKAKASAKKR
jgi:hypothetical protein